VEKVVDNMARGKCIPMDLMKSEDDCSNLGYNSGIGDFIKSDKTNLVYLVGSCYLQPGWRYSS